MALTNVEQKQSPDCQSEPGFIAGNIKNFLNAWKQVTNDEHVLQTVKGCKIEFKSPPFQYKVPGTIKFSPEETDSVNKEVNIMLEKGVIRESVFEQGQFVSNIFVRPKKDGRFRVILNLTRFNEFVISEHFKMDSIFTCMNLVTEKCFMASIDLRDAYYSIPVHRDFTKFLKFFWNGILYEYTCLPMGLACAPRTFVKLLKPVFAKLHSNGFVSSPYLDDTFLQGDTFQICENNVKETVKLLTNLGFFVHHKKSIKVPCQKMEHLGFILDTVNMTISLTEDKKEKLVTKIDKVLTNTRPTIRSVASVIGSIISYLPAIQYGQLFYREIEKEKIVALKQSQGNFEATMALSNTARDQLLWWKDRSHLFPAPLVVRKPELTLCTDASGEGWGASTGEKKCGGRWTEREKALHINMLEMQAIEFGLLALCNDRENTHIKIKSDNVTAVAYVRNMGGCKSPGCDTIAKRIWMWAKKKNIWLSITHIEGRLNVEPDTLSRQFDDKTEWMINPVVFKNLQKIFPLEIDLFASRLNKQLDKYVSWQPDPQALAVDAFTLDWSMFFNYIFCPFSMLTQALRKIEIDRAEAVIIAPFWPAQSWFGKLARLLINFPVFLPRGRKLLQLPFDREQVHPLWRKMRLLAWPVSGKSYKSQDFRKNLQKSCLTPGDPAHRDNITPTWESGLNIVIDNVSINLHQM